MGRKPRPAEESAPPPLDRGDFYLENGFMVFTREYHLKRGFCCKSGCRHCPWGYREELEKKAAEQKTAKKQVGTSKS